MFPRLKRQSNTYFDWTIDWSTDWSIDSLIDWKSHIIFQAFGQCSLDWLIDRSIDGSIDGWMDGWIDWLYNFPGFQRPLGWSFNLEPQPAVRLHGDLGIVKYSTDYSTAYPTNYNMEHSTDHSMDYSRAPRRTTSRCTPWTDYQMISPRDG